MAAAQQLFTAHDVDTPAECDRPKNFFFSRQEFLSSSGFWFCLYPANKLPPVGDGSVAPEGKGINMELSRRSFCRRTAAAAAVGAAGITAANSNRVAYAAEAETATEMNEEADSESEETSTYDAIIVGSGFSGMSAALSLQEAGKSVVVLEKRPESGYGGNSRVCVGALLVPPTDDEEGEEIFVSDMMEKSSDQADEDLVRVFAEGAWDGIYWLQGFGLDVGSEFVTLDPYEVVYTYNPDGGPSTIMSTLKDAYEANGGEIVFSAKLLDLVMDDSARITGVKARTENGLVTYYADNVIIATGGYSGNKGFLEEYIGPEADQMLVRGFEHMTGDGMLAAYRVGAGLIQVGGYEGLHIVAVSPQNTAYGTPSSAIPYSVAINSEGCRFVDESLGYVAHGKAVAEQPGSVDAVVLDAGIIEAESNVADTVESMAEYGVDVLTADTIEELAELIEVDPDTLVATIEEYNEHVNDDGTTSGLDVDKAACAYKIENPPYYAYYPLNPGITQSFGGLYVNTSFQVLEPDGEVIPGLYAVGESIGGWAYDDYLGGASMMSCLVSGRTAASAIAAE